MVTRLTRRLDGRAENIHTSSFMNARRSDVSHQKLLFEHETAKGKQRVHSNCRYKMLRPTSHPPDFRSFVGTAWKSSAVPPAYSGMHKR